MLTWRLRRAFNDPLNRSLHEQAYLHIARLYQRDPTTSSGFGFTRRSPLASLARAIGLSVLPIAAILFGAPVFVVLLFAIFMFSPVLVPLANMLYGLVITVQVSGRITRERNSGRYDVLGTTPPGVIGLHWTYTLTGMLRNRGLRDVTLVMMVVGMVAAIFGVAAMFGSIPTFSLAYWVISTACALGIIIYDNFGTQVTAGLLSMIVPAYTTSTASARMITAATFLLLQITGYVAALVTLIVLLPAIFLRFAVSDEWIVVSLPLVTLLVFGGFREFTVRYLWRRLPAALNATLAELDKLC